MTVVRSIDAHAERFSSPSLHAEILNRVVMGNKVIDHERVRGIRDQPLEALAVYEVAGELIHAVWFFYPDEPFPAPDVKGADETGSL